MALRLQALTPSSPCSAFTVREPANVSIWDGGWLKRVRSHLKFSLILCRSRKTRDRRDGCSCLFCPTPCLFGSLWLFRLFFFFCPAPTAPSVLATLVTTLLFLMCEMWHYETTPPSSLFWPKNVHYKSPMAAVSSQSAGTLDFLTLSFHALVCCSAFRTSGSSHDTRLGCVTIKRQYRTPTNDQCEGNSDSIWDVSEILYWFAWVDGLLGTVFRNLRNRQIQAKKKKIVVTSVDLEYLLMTPTCKKATMIKSSCCSVVPLSFFKANVKM